MYRVHAYSSYVEYIHQAYMMQNRWLIIHGILLDMLNPDAPEVGSSGTHNAADPSAEFYNCDQTDANCQCTKLNPR